MKMYDFFHGIANFFWEKYVGQVKRGNKKDGKKLKKKAK